jgi:hypothetical protein
MVLTWKRIALSSVAAGLLVGGGWMWLQEATASIVTTPTNSTFPRQDEEANCTGDRSHRISVNGGPAVDADTQGVMQAVAGATSLTADGRLKAQLTVTNTSTVGYVEGVGNLVITLDKNKPAVPSSLIANQKEAPFPATQTMRFYPLFILNDEVFSSSTPVHVVSSSVTSFPPAPGTIYVLTNAVTLVSEKGNTISLTPGRAFTITGG